MNFVNKIIAWINARVDKVLHFCAGYIIATILPIPIICGFSLAIIAGVVKEYFIRKKNKAFDYTNAIVTALGGAIGYIVLFLK